MRIIPQFGMASIPLILLTLPAFVAVLAAADNAMLGATLSGFMKFYFKMSGLATFIVYLSLFVRVEWD